MLRLFIDSEHELRNIPIAGAFIASNGAREVAVDRYDLFSRCFPLPPVQGKFPGTDQGILHIIGILTVRQRGEGDHHRESYERHSAQIGI